MLTTRYVDGAPNWLDLGTPDLDGAQVFYGGLFGWSFQSAGPDAGGYGMFQLDGKSVAGAMKVAAEQSPPSWNVYFQTADADATAAKAEEAGGSAVFKPMDIMDQGRMAVLADAAGAAFGLWQPAANKGLDKANEPGALCWLELYTPDVAGGTGFYGSVFDWQITEAPFEGGSYTMVSPPGGGDSAAFGGVVPLAMDPKAAAPYWLCYFEVTDADATVAQAKELGGTALGEPMDVPDVGRIAQLADPSGVRFAVIKSAGQSA